MLDILSDRFCAAAFYFGLAWLQPEHVLPVLVYLAEFMVVDCFLSLAFLAWPIRSPNYFYVVDRTIWLWNWSKPAKAANSAHLRGDPAGHGDAAGSGSAIAARPAHAQVRVAGGLARSGCRSRHDKVGPCCSRP